LLASLVGLITCTAGVSLSEANKVLTSFSIQWPEGFDNRGVTQVPITITIYALDQNGEKFSWEGTVDLLSTNPNLTLETNPETITLTGGEATVEITFYSINLEDDVTSLKVRYQDVITQTSDSIYVVYAEPPSASFSADVIEGEPPLTVKFTDGLSGYIIS